jgi:aminoglycoside phosphotransferase (APT) family kinase protein
MLMPDNGENIEPFAEIDLDEMSAKLINYVRKELDSESVDYLEPLTRLTGGFETLICRFRLSGVGERLSKPLIIRVFAEYSNIGQPVKEGVVQNALAEQGYPVPAVYSTCIDKTVLGNAFLIMDYFDGETVLESNMPFDKVSAILGNLHARMHQIDPEPIITKFAESEWDIRALTLERRLEWLLEQANSNYPWLNDAAQWLSDNRPNGPERLSICHCDFHPLNLLFKDGKVQAVLDWGSFMLGDPAMDVAWTDFLLSIPLKIIMPDLDPENLREIYFGAYRQIRPLDEENIAYYGAVRSVQALLEGAQGQAVWRHPEAVKLLQASIDDVIGIKIDVPF